MLGEIAQQACGVGPAQQRRRLAHRDGAGTEGFDREPEARQFLGAVDQLLDGRLVQLDDFRDQQDLSLYAVLRQLRLQSLIDDALMRGMLVDEDETIARL